MGPASENKPVLILSLVLASVFAAAAFALKRADCAFGLLLGAAASYANFYLLFRDFSTIYKPGVKEEQMLRARSSLSGRFFGRYAVLAATFYGAYHIPGIQFLAFVGGFAIVHLSLAAAGFARLVRSTR